MVDTELGNGEFLKREKKPASLPMRVFLLAIRRASEESRAAL
jgi:hypothetical protein